VGSTPVSRDLLVAQGSESFASGGAALSRIPSSGGATPRPAGPCHRASRLGNSSWVASEALVGRRSRAGTAPRSPTPLTNRITQSRQRRDDLIDPCALLTRPTESWSEPWSRWQRLCRVPVRDGPSNVGVLTLTSPNSHRGIQTPGS